mgnify:CR=1 FL=1|tara:strand:- start:3402 stop:3842 length:441 start_codon:yes stop_codon:yes gene_type:complete
MIKVYKKGVNVCIEGYSLEIPIYFIPTHLARLDSTSNSIIITDTYSGLIDRFLIPLSLLATEQGLAIPLKAAAETYLAEFVGKSYCCDDTPAVIKEFTYVVQDAAVTYGVGEIETIVYKDSSSVITKTTTFTYNVDNKVATITDTF